MRAMPSTPAERALVVSVKYALSPAAPARTYTSPAGCRQPVVERLPERRDHDRIDTISETLATIVARLTRAWPGAPRN